MYHINHNPPTDVRYLIRLNHTGSYYQLIGETVGVVAESDSWRRLKKYAELNKLNLTSCKIEDMVV